MEQLSLEDVLECSVCLDTLSLQNKVLPCQHTFCTKCLQDIYGKHGYLHCPECRQPVPGDIQALPSNILLNRMLERLRIGEKQDGAKTSGSPVSQVFIGTPTPAKVQGASRHYTDKCLVTLTPSNYQNVAAHSFIKESIISSSESKVLPQNFNRASNMSSFCQVSCSTSVSPSSSSSSAHGFNTSIASFPAQSSVSPALSHSIAVSSHVNSTGCLTASPMSSQRLSSTQPYLVPSSTKPAPSMTNNVNLNSQPVLTPTSIHNRVPSPISTSFPSPQSSVASPWNNSTVPSSQANQQYLSSNNNSQDKFAPLRMLDQSLGSSRRHSAVFSSVMSCHDARIMDGTNISQGNKSLNSSPHHNNSQYNTGKPNTNPFLNNVMSSSQTSLPNMHKDSIENKSSQDLFKDWQLSPRAILTPVTNQTQGGAIQSSKPTNNPTNQPRSTTAAFNKAQSQHAINPPNMSSLYQNTMVNSMQLQSGSFSNTGILQPISSPQLFRTQSPIQQYSNVPFCGTPPNNSQQGGTVPNGAAANSKGQQIGTVPSGAAANSKGQQGGTVPSGAAASSKGQQGGTVPSGAAASNKGQQGGTVQSGAAASTRGQQMQGVYEAICDYHAQKEDEISLMRGEKYLLTDVYGDGWARGKNLRTGSCGVFPYNHLRRYSTVPQETKDGPTDEIDGQEDRLEKLKKIREMLKQNNPQNIPKPPSKSSDVRYRCIVPFPASSEFELTLQVGDVILVERIREDGWCKGKHQRTGKRGLFPASFVERIN